MREEKQLKQLKEQDPVMFEKLLQSKGIYRSEDAGKSWDHIGLENVGQIGAVEIHPDDPNIIYVAAIGQPFKNNEDRGLFKSTEGGK